MFNKKYFPRSPITVWLSKISQYIFFFKIFLYFIFVLLLSGCKGREKNPYFLPRHDSRNSAHFPMAVLCCPVPLYSPYNMASQLFTQKLATVQFHLQFNFLSVGNVLFWLKTKYFSFQTWLFKVFYFILFIFIYIYFFLFFPLKEFNNKMLDEFTKVALEN